MSVCLAGLCRETAVETPCRCCHTRQLPGSQGTGGFQPGEGTGGNCWLRDRPLTPVSVPLRACSPPRDTEPTSAAAAVVSCLPRRHWSARSVVDAGSVYSSTTWLARQTGAHSADT